MSTNRVSPESGWGKGVEKGPNGRNLCRWCKVEVPKGRRTFCSEPCIHEHRLRSDPGYVRGLVERRDKGVCAQCGLDTVEFAKRHRHRLKAFHDKCFARLLRLQGERGAWDNMAAWSKSHQREKVWQRRTGYRHGHQWEADHIVPVVEGGGECGLEGYRTLCIRCHKEATKALAARRAEARRSGREGE